MVVSPLPFAPVYEKVELFAVREVEEEGDTISNGVPFVPDSVQVLLPASRIVWFESKAFPT